MAIAVVDEAMLREPRLLVPNRRPLGRVTIDRSHPLGQACAMFWVRNVDLVSGKRALAGQQSTLSPDAWTAGTNPTVIASYGTETEVAGRLTAGTAILEMAFNTGYDNNEGIAFRTGTDVEGVSWSTYSAVLRLGLARNNSTSSVATGVSSSAGPVFQSAVVFNTAETNFEHYYNGCYEGAYAMTGVGAWDFPAQKDLVILAAPANEVNLFSLCVFRRKLTPAELFSYYLDKYQFLVPA
jgi:hypothetical protein